MSYELKEYLNSINHTKVNLMDSGDEMYEKKYSSFLVNKCLAPFDKQTCLFVNEVNRRPHLDNKLQFDFLINSLRRMNRFTPWLKSKKVNDIEYVKEYYGYSNEKAKSALTILSNEQLKYIKKKLNKGGRPVSYTHLTLPTTCSG